MAVPSGGTGGALVGALEVVAGDEITIVSAGGTVTRLDAAEVPEQGRRTRGSRIVKLAEGDRIVEVTRSLGTEDEKEDRERRSETGRGSEVGAGAPDEEASTANAPSSGEPQSDLFEGE